MNDFPIIVGDHRRIGRLENGFNLCLIIGSHTGKLNLKIEDVKEYKFV